MILLPFNNAIRNSEGGHVDKNEYFQKIIGWNFGPLGIVEVIQKSLPFRTQ